MNIRISEGAALVFIVTAIASCSAVGIVSSNIGKADIKAACHKAQAAAFAASAPEVPKCN